MTGIYAGTESLAVFLDPFLSGWASVGPDQTIYKMVMSIGWNPFYKNKKKTAEAWLLHEFPEVRLILFSHSLHCSCLQDFYGEDLRLIVCGYLRPESDFTSLEELKTQIHQDAKLADVFLNNPNIVPFKTDPSLSPIFKHFN